MKRLFLLGLLLSPVFAQTHTSAKLPVKRVVLYKNGVGYFEHTGSVTGNQDVTIDFTSSQLNDALKSLTILDQGEGRITGVRYNSATPLEQQLNTLHLNLAKDISYADLLTALRGSRVEVRDKGLVTLGRILAVEDRQVPQGENRPVLNQTILSIVGDGGDVRSFVVTPALAVRPLEGDIREDLGRYLSMLASARAQDLRRMTVSAQGAGARNIFVSYISEVPVWKTSYRILLPDDANKPALMQGWAIVDNTVGEDWNNVELALVSGAPQSFVQNLSQPYYVRRPQIGLPETAMLTPQTHESGFAAPAKAGAPGTITGTLTDPAGAVIPNATVIVNNEVDGTSRSAVTDANGNYWFRDLPTGTYELKAQTSGFATSSVNGLAVSPSQGVRQDITLSVGSTSDSIEVEAAAPSGGPHRSKQFDRVAQMGKLQTVNGGVIGGVAGGIAAGLGGGVGTGSGSGFGPGRGGNSGGGVYRMSSPAPSLYETFSEQLPRAESANTQELAGLFEYTIKDRVSVAKNQSALVPILNTRIKAEHVTLWNANEPMPLRSVWLENTSGETLDGGSFSILDGNAFAGEGIFETIRPKEKRLLSYAVDDAVHISREGERKHEPLRHVKIAKGVLTETTEERENVTYSVRNSDIHRREVVLEHPADDSWKLVSDIKPEESTGHLKRFRVKVAPGETASLKVEMVHPLFTTTALINDSEERLGLLIKHIGNDSELAQKLKPLVAKRADLSVLDRQLNANRNRISEIQQDQQRLRENMKALKGSAEERALLQRYTSELNGQEDELASLKKQNLELEAKRQRAMTALSDEIALLSFDSDVSGATQANGGR